MRQILAATAALAWLLLAESPWISAVEHLAAQASPPSTLLFLQNDFTGGLLSWRLDGVTRVDERPLEPGALLRRTWRIVGNGDFNGDGHPDVVWQEDGGDLALWLMNGSTRLWFEPFTPSSTAPSPRWKVEAVADVNQDGRPDLVWREQDHGWLVAWIMDGVRRTEVVGLNPGTVDPLWSIAGAADFNGDGHVDLLWRHREQGLLTVRLMNGVDRIATTPLTPDRVYDPSWRIAALADMNGDGRADIVWQHESGGWLYVWLMHGTSRSAGVYLDPPASDAGWQVRAAGAAPAQSTLTVAALLSRSAERIWGPMSGGAVVDVDPPGWRGAAAALPAVVSSGTDLRLYFAGFEDTGNPYLYRSRIGLATSDDGINFAIANGGQPVLSEGPASAFDGHSVSHPAVLPVESGSGPEWWMYYAGADGAQGWNGVRVERVGLARSRDGVSWERTGTAVVDIGAAGEIDSIQVASPFVLRAGRFFQMWYGAYDGAHRIAYATSTDGLHWTKRGAVRGLRGAGAGELGPSVYYDGREYLMWYGSLDEASQQWRTYAARSRDGISWTEANGGAPIAGDAPAGTFAEAGAGRNSLVHLSELLQIGPDLLGYYVGEDAQSVMRIGVLRLEAPPLPAALSRR